MSIMYLKLKSIWTLVQRTNANANEHNLTMNEEGAGGDYEEPDAGLEIDIIIEIVNLNPDEEAGAEGDATFFYAGFHF